ncbi:MAG: Phosphoglycolate phosphatase [Verrucomicrobia subdivision 3 bacterium]|nr:Phosphoglycolate phosphatase [Limisphaerales bacterium]MCS1414165.1 Phosphoglycolate phosphatase [Limisphaerales bacterium]
MNHPAAVLFDLDGTLLDTLEEIATTANAVLDRHGYSGHKIEAYRYFIGGGVGRLVERILPEGCRSNEQVRQFTQELADEYERRSDLLTKIYPGIPELLTALEDLEIDKAILSNKPHHLTLSCVSRFLSAWRFHLVLGQKAGIPRKPDPAGALKVAEDLGLPATSVLYVGDTDVDMTTARAAGMTSVGVLWGFRSREELVAHHADFIVEAPDEILSFLN